MGMKGIENHQTYADDARYWPTPSDNQIMEDIDNAIDLMKQETGFLFLENPYIQPVVVQVPVIP